MDNKILFAWDFHGTLEKGNINAVRELCGMVLSDCGIKREVRMDDVSKWYGLSWLDYFKLLAPEGNPQLWESMVAKVLNYQDMGWNIVKKHIKAQDFAKDVLGEIKNRGHENILVTNSGQSYAKKFVELVGLSGYMDEVIGVDTHYNSRADKDIHNIKADALRNYLQDKKYNKVVMVGDKESDISAGNDCGATTYLFLTPEAGKKTESTKADHIISDLRKVLEEL
ncbi:MAG: HAD hydrolase-like protein [Parcubacteria group bacterium]